MILSAVGPAYPAFWLTLTGQPSKSLYAEVLIMSFPREQEKGKRPPVKPGKPGKSK